MVTDYLIEKAMKAGLKSPLKVKLEHKCETASKLVQEGISVPEVVLKAGVGKWVVSDCLKEVGLKSMRRQRSEKVKNFTKAVLLV